MLTIKVIRPDGSKVEPNDFSRNDFSEFIEEARTVFYNTPSQSGTKHHSVTYFAPGRDTPIDIYEGTIYVMNEAGKTIANYDLGYGFIKSEGEGTSN